MRPKALRAARFAVLLALGLAACTAYSHRSSIERLERNYEARLAAERAALEGLSDGANGGTRDALALEVEREPGPSLAEARLALALDAQRDLEEVTSDFVDASEYDRISALYRASLKVWHAGNAWQNAGPDAGLNANAPNAINREGETRCNGLKENAPPRDCAIIFAAPSLRVMEIAAKNIFDAHIARRTGVPAKGERLALIFKSIGDIETEMAELQTGGTATELKRFTAESLNRFLEAQYAAYFCEATRGVADLIRIGSNGSALRQQGREAADWLRGLSGSDPLSPELAALLAENGVEGPGTAKGAYARLLDRINPILSKDWTPAEQQDALDWCTQWSQSRS